MAGTKVILFGATSAIAEATARRLAAAGAEMALVGRDAGRLATIAADLEVRGAARVLVHETDLVGCPEKGSELDAIADALGGLDAVLFFYGVLGDPARWRVDTAHVREVLDVNFVSVAEWLTVASARLAASTSTNPVLLVVSSVAGDRGRGSNYVYGAAKGGLSLFVQGLDHHLARKGAVRAVAMKVGFVDTPMTAAIEKNGALWSTPDRVAEDIVRAMARGGPFVYSPWFWRWIMLIVRLLPRWLMNRLDL